MTEWKIPLFSKPSKPSLTARSQREADEMRLEMRLARLSKLREEAEREERVHTELDMNSRL